MELLGKPVVGEIYNKIKKRNVNESVKLAIIQVGDNPASNVYVKNKINKCIELGFKHDLYKFDDNVTENTIINLINFLNSDDSVKGIFVQMPLPENLNEEVLINTISPFKDVDGLTDTNLGKLFNNKSYHTPCTAQGIIEMLNFYNIELAGKNVCIVGRSNLVGKPLFHLLTNKNATVTLCHSKTKNLKEITKKADILIVAIGVPKFITSDFVSEGQTIIDVGINRTDIGLVGDVDFDNVKNIVENITPVPKGVGLTTVACLMKNVSKYVF